MYILYVYTLKHTYAHLYTLIHTYTHLYTPMHTYTHLCAPIRTYTHLYYTPIRTYTHLYAPIHTYTHLYTPIHTYTHLYTPIHTYTHQSKEDYSRVLEKEMTAALKELQGLVGEGRGIINKHVNYQQNQITSSMAALTKNLNDLEIAGEE